MTGTTETNTHLPPADVEYDAAQLVACVGELFRRLSAPADGRISRSLDLRSVRYYQSLGLLEGPRRYDGRRAVYGREHIVSLICIRALQGSGRTLSQIQHALAVTPGQDRIAAAQEALAAAAEHSVTRSAADQESEADKTPRPRALVAVELAPGVTVTVDPAQVEDADGVIAALMSAMQALTEARRPAPHETTSPKQEPSP